MCVCISFIDEESRKMDLHEATYLRAFMLVQLDLFYTQIAKFLSRETKEMMVLEPGLPMYGWM